MPSQVRIVRIFNTYGPKMALDDGRVVSNFVAQVCVPLYGSGVKQRRSLTLQLYCSRVCLGGETRADSSILFLTSRLSGYCCMLSVPTCVHVSCSSATGLKARRKHLHAFKLPTLTYQPSPPPGPDQRAHHSVR